MHHPATVGTRLRHHTRQAAASLLLMCAAVLPAAAALPWDNARQLVLVVTPDWDSAAGTLQRFERDSAGQWQAVTAASDVAVGRKGSAWGIGLHAAQADGPQKQEGDGRSPAGVFTVGEAFGYAGKADTGLPYQAMTAGHYCIDVNGSSLYNRIVDQTEVGAEAVKGSTEPMRRDLHAKGDVVYRQGFVINHNPQNISGAGSCIFAHLWRKPGEPTAGCTAMPDPVMEDMLAWLQADQHPVFVLLPQAEYERLHHEWQLPHVEAVP